MNNNFLNGFADELTKTAAHPLFTSVTKGGTLLGKKVRGMMTRATQASRKPRMKKKAGAALEKCDPKGICKGGKHGCGKGAGDKYGGGTGNFEGKQAPAFTDKINPTDTPGAFGKK